MSANFRENSIFRFWPWRSRLDLSWHWKSGSSKMGKILIFSCSFEMHQWLHSGNERISFVGFGASESKRYFKNDSRIGCKPFQEKNLEIGILCTSDSVFSPDFEYGYQKKIECTWTLYMTEKLVSVNLRNFEKIFKTCGRAFFHGSN